MLKLERITFGLENCDSITIDGDNIKFLEINNIRRRIRKCVNGYVDNVIISNDFEIIIDKRANISYRQFGLAGEEIFVFTRLTHHDDIVDIVVTLLDEGVEKQYLILFGWVGDCDEINYAQSSSFTRSGDLHIQIKS